MLVVGIGPGHPLDRTRRAENAIARADVVVGYARYVAHIRDLTAGKEVVSSGMREEVERCRLALQRAAKGQVAALVSSGDAGIYGMAGLAIELAHEEQVHVPIEVVAGVTAASAAAARLGAPLMLDFATISLSDLLIPWETIRRRVEAVAAADLTVVFYNPRSGRRVRQLQEAVDILLRHRPADTPAGIGAALGTDEERLLVTTLDDLCRQDIDMRTVVIVGNSTTQVLNGWLVTPRGYRR